MEFERERRAFYLRGRNSLPSPPPPSPATADDIAEDEEQVDAVAEETEEEDSEARTLPAWHQAHNRRRARQVIVLLDQNVLDAMSTDDLIWIMQAGFQSLTARRAQH